jgi:hypothetical protein
MSTGTRIVVAGVLACLLGVVASTAASAAGFAVSKNANFAGYDATASTPITTFSGGITLPTVTCPTTGSGSSFFAEVDLGDAFGTVAILSVGGQCLPANNGVATIFPASIQLISNVSPSLDAGASVGLAAGQTVNATITVNTGAGMTSLTITNPATKTKGSASTPLAPSFTSVNAGLDQTAFSGPGNVTPIPTFTAFTFSGLKFNGATLATLSPTESEMFDGSTLQVATSTIAANGSFSTIFKHV